MAADGHEASRVHPVGAGHGGGRRTGRVAFAAGQPDRHSGKWIIPTNKPDRFGLKVMAFNPILVPDPAQWTLAIGGLTQAAVDAEGR